MPRRTKSANQRLVERARKVTTESDKQEWRAAWVRVYLAVKASDGGLIQAERARVAMLQANVDELSVAEAERLALAAGGAL